MPEPDAGDRAYEAHVDRELNGGDIGPGDDEYWDFVPGFDVTPDGNLA